MTTFTTEEAYNILRQDYFDDVELMAESLKDDWKSGDYEDRDSFIEHIDEVINGCNRVIYTQKAAECLMVSDNDSEAVDQLGPGGIDWKNGFPWSQLAYFAFRQDVIKKLDEIGIDIDEDPIMDPRKKDPENDNNLTDFELKALDNFFGEEPENISVKKVGNFLNARWTNSFRYWKFINDNITKEDVDLSKDQPLDEKDLMSFEIEALEDAYGESIEDIDIDSVRLIHGNAWANAIIRYRED